MAFSNTPLGRVENAQMRLLQQRTPVVDYLQIVKEPCLRLGRHIYRTLIADINIKIPIFGYRDVLQRSIVEVLLQRISDVTHPTETATHKLKLVIQQDIIDKRPWSCCSIGVVPAWLLQKVCDISSRNTVDIRCRSLTRCRAATLQQAIDQVQHRDIGIYRTASAVALLVVAAAKNVDLITRSR